MKYLTLIGLIICLAACKSGNTDTTQSNNQADEDVLAMHPDYPNIPLAERGITMVNKKGWEASTYDFHLGYCQQMMASIEETVDTHVFCDCFISKIQYYYPPTFFKEAYEDQVKWNQMCYQMGADAKANQQSKSSN